MRRFTIVPNAMKVINIGFLPSLSASGVKMADESPNPRKIQEPKSPISMPDAQNKFDSGIQLSISSDYSLKC